MKCNVCSRPNLNGFRWQQSSTILLSVFLWLCSPCRPLQASGTNSSSGDPTLVAPALSLQQAISPSATTITFSEFSVGTFITSQYSSLGVLFSGSDAGTFITTDSSNPTAPVLSGSPLFVGSITAIFVSPTDPATHIVANNVTFDAGYFNAVGSTTLTWFDVNGTVLGSQVNTSLGIERFTIPGSIGGFTMAITGNEAAGYAIDNLAFELSSNTAPIANDQSVATAVNTPLLITLTATDEDNDPLTYLIVASPEHGTLSDFDPAAGTVTYTPDPDYTGSDSFTFSAGDQLADSLAATVAITVGCDSFTAQYPLGDGTQRPFVTGRFGGNATGVKKTYKGHLGEDYRADDGTPVHAFACGNICAAETVDKGPGTFGIWIVIEHTLPDGTIIHSLYAHLQELQKSEGFVNKGEIIALSGHTGGVVKHLHFGILDGKKCNPGRGYSGKDFPETQESEKADGRIYYNPTLFIEQWKQP